MLALRHGTIPPHLHFHEPQPAHRLGAAAARGADRRASRGRAGAAAPRRRELVRLQRHQRARRPRGGAGRRRRRPARAERPLTARALGAQPSGAARSWPRRYADAAGSRRRGRAPRRRRLHRAVGRSRTARRAAVCVAGDATRSASRALADGRRAGDRRGGARPASAPQVAFLFTGQGAQYAGMGRAALRDASRRSGRRSTAAPTLLDAAARSAAARRARTRRRRDAALLDQHRLHPAGAVRPRVRARRAVARPGASQPARCSGHSVGEFVAACVAGVFASRTGCGWSPRAAALMQALPAGGAMAAVFADGRTTVARRRPLCRHVRGSGAQLTGGRRWSRAPPTPSRRPAGAHCRRHGFPPPACGSRTPSIRSSLMNRCSADFAQACGRHPVPGADHPRLSPISPAETAHRHDPAHTGATGSAICASPVRFADGIAAPRRRWLPTRSSRSGRPARCWASPGNV